MKRFLDVLQDMLLDRGTYTYKYRSDGTGVVMLKPDTWYHYTYRYCPEGHEHRWEECDGDTVIIVRKGTLSY